VRPAHLPPGRVEAVVGDEAVGADDASELVTEQRVQMLLAPAGGDPQDGGALTERAPERAQLAGEIPAGLVDVERAGRTRLLEQRLVDRLQCLAGASEDRVDRPGRNRAAKQLVQQLHQLAARETISHRQSGDRGLQLRAEAAARHPNRQLGAHRATAAGTADPLQAMLADLDRERRQLRHLMTRRCTARLMLILAKDVAAPAAPRPVLDHLAHPLERKQRPPMAGMARLAAPLSPRPP
jgi:hypothetical protein